MTTEENEQTEQSAPPAPPAPERPAAPPAQPAAERPAGPPRRAERNGGDADQERPERRRRHFGRRKVCAFCAEKVQAIDYKDPMRLRRYLSDRARVEPRRKTGTCAKHQRWLAVALKRARHLALLPYTPEHIRISGVTTGRAR